MGFCKTQAVALKRVDYGNSSQIATLYTRDYGKIRVLARGSKRAEKKSPGSIDLFSYLEIVFMYREGTGLHLLTEWESLRDFSVFRNDIERFYAGCYVVELVDELTVEGDRNGPLFDLILDTFYGLSRLGDIEIVLRAFELQMLKLLGYLPQLDECVSCGVEFGERTGAVLSPVNNGLLCRRCSGSGARPSLSPGTLRTALLLTGSDAMGRRRLRLPHRVSAELKALSQGCIAFALNKPVGTRGSL